MSTKTKKNIEIISVFNSSLNILVFIALLIYDIL